MRIKVYSAHDSSDTPKNNNFNRANTSFDPPLAQRHDVLRNIKNEYGTSPSAKR